MATQELTQDLSVPLTEVECGHSSSGTVADGGWKQVLPDLPDEVIALLATPVVVTTDALTRASAPVRSVAPTAGIDECTPRFLAPTPPRRIQARHRFA